MSYQSVFEQVFDVAVYGSGYAAFAAAMKLHEEGQRVLLFHRRPDLLWESGRAYSSEAGNLANSDWEKFLSELKKYNLYREGRIDGAGAEIVSTTLVYERREQLRVLYGAWPVAVELAGEQLASVHVATKSGERVLRAHRWIDASDEGTLFTLAFPETKDQQRCPDFYEQRALLVASGAWNVEVSDIGDALLEPRVWEGEGTLCFRNASPDTLTELANRAIAVRDSLSEGGQSAAIVQFSVYPLPVYKQRKEGSESPLQRGNLISASAAYSDSAVRTLADRFGLGINAAELYNSVTCAPDIQSGATQIRSLPIRKRSCGVLIAGAGTGGAIAALAAGQRKADFLVMDPAPFAGGVGTGGMINGYCHGEKGGLFEQNDAWAEEFRKKLEPNRQMSQGWHADAKKIAFERVLQEVGRPLLGESVAYDVQVDQGKVVCVKVATPGEILEIAPAAVIDATGDGDLAALAGAEYDHGREEDGHPLAYSQPCMRVVLDDGKRLIRGGNYDAGWVDATDPEDLTRGRLVGVKQYIRDRYTNEAHILCMAPVLGLRQSRNFRTEEILTMDDLIRHRDSENSFGKARSFLDTHAVDFQYEGDETMFWLWGCKNFRGEVCADLPYGILIPKGLRNLWLACRAAGVTPSAAYAVRMQRDIQRMGEAAGYAAALAAETGKDALQLQPKDWRPFLQETGAYCENPGEIERHGSIKVYDLENPLPQLESGIPAGYLWALYKGKEQYEEAVVGKLQDSNPHVSWLAAVVLAMWSDVRAEPRLIQAIDSSERGVDTPRYGYGAFQQLVDVPNWLQAISLLRRCGTAACLESLKRVAQRPGNILDVRTPIAITIGRLASRLNGTAREQAAEILRALVADPVPETFLPPSRSAYRTLLGEPQQQLSNQIGSDTREDHSWRLTYVVARAAKALGVASPVDVTSGRNDERALVRRAFQRL